VVDLLLEVTIEFLITVVLIPFWIVMDTGLVA
jgi:hypothetical protein